MILVLIIDDAYALWYIEGKELILMKTTNYSIRLDPEVKSRAESIFSELGLNLSDSFNVFLHMSIKRKGFPFEVSLLEPKQRLLESINEADEIEAQIRTGVRKPYATVADMNAAMNAEDAAENAHV